MVSRKKVFYLTISMLAFVLIICFSLACNGYGEVKEKVEEVRDDLEEAEAEIKSSPETEQAEEEMVEEDKTKEEPEKVEVEKEAKIELVSYNSYLRYDYFNVVGEIVNNGSAPAEYIKIIVTFYDKDKKMVDTSFTYSDVEVLNPGSKSPFNVSIEDKDIDSIELQVQWENASYPNNRENEIEILEHSSYVEYDYFNIVGKVKNTSDSEQEFIKIIASIYDKDGNILDTTFTYTDIERIKPEETSPFKMSVENMKEFNNYSLVVD